MFTVVCVWVATVVDLRVDLERVIPEK